MFLLSDLRWGWGISKKLNCLFPQADRDWKHWHRVSGEKPQVKLQPFSKGCLVPTSSDSHVSSMGQHCGLYQALSEGALFVFSFPFPQTLCQHKAGEIEYFLWKCLRDNQALRKCRRYGTFHTHTSAEGWGSSWMSLSTALLLLHAGAKPHSPHLMGHPTSQWVLASSLLAANGEQQAPVSLYPKISCSWTCLIMVKSISPHQASPQLDTGCIKGHFLCAHRLCWDCAAAASTIPCWVKPRVYLAPWHIAPGQNWAKSTIHTNKGQKVLCFLLKISQGGIWKHSRWYVTKDGTPTHLSSLLCPPQVWVLETPKIHTEEFWDLWMFLHLFVNAANPKLARRSGRIICQLLVSSAILEKNVTDPLTLLLLI